VEPGPAWWVKIGDFGISKRLIELTALRTRIGTPGYLAPELTELRDFFDSQQLSYTVAVDIWALGQITFRMLCKRMAFDDSGPGSLFNYVVRNSPLATDLLEQNGASADCCDFIKRTLVALPPGRPTAREASNHAWIRSALPRVDPMAPHGSLQYA
jgi:serine/threonine protein kinase